MLDLLIIDEETQLAKLHPALKTILCFKEIIERDRGKTWKIVGDNDGRHKYLATLEVSYIFWEGTYRSHYADEYPDEKIRLENIKKDIGLPEKWKPDEVVLEALEYYRRSQITPSMRFIKTAKKAVDQIEGYLDTTNLTEKIDSGPHKGQLVHDVKKYRDTFDGFPDTIKRYKEIQNIIDSEVEEKKKGRGGKTRGLFEDD